MKRNTTNALSIRTLIFIFSALLLLTACGKSDGGAGIGAAETTTSAGADAGSGSETSADETGADEFGKFTAVDPDGNTVTEEILTGHKLTMINVWGTNCPYCIDEMPDLAELNDDYAGEGFQVVGIVSDVYAMGSDAPERDVERVKSILEETSADYVNMFVSQDWFTLLIKDVNAVPTTIFIDEDGNQVGKTYLGAKSYDDWAEIIESLLEEVG